MSRKFEIALRSLSLRENYAVHTSHAFLIIEQAQKFETGQTNHSGHKTVKQYHLLAAPGVLVVKGLGLERLLTPRRITTFG
jgi:hypothetical protein